MNKIKAIAIGFLILFGTTVWAHDDTHSIKSSDSIVSVLAILESFSEFSTLHPLIVHFPIVLIMVAFLTQLFNVFWRKREFSIFIIFILAACVIACLLAIFPFHPHTENLTPNELNVLIYHEFLAYIATGLATLSLTVKIFHFNFKAEVMGFKYFNAGILFLAIFAISLAGHLGAQLVHIEGVGVKGKNIRLHQHLEKRKELNEIENE